MKPGESITGLRQARALGFAACALAGTLWGGSFLVGKIALAEMGFAQMILWRLSSQHRL